MKCIVLKPFKDKDTQKTYKKGMTYTCSEERFKEVQDKGEFLSPFKKIKQAKE